MSQYSEETPVKTTPDFSALALVLLLEDCRQLDNLARDAIQGAASYEPITILATSMRATLRLLQRPGAALFAQELHLLSAHLHEQAESIEEHETHTLLDVIATLSDYLNYLLRPGAMDSVLQTLPVLNACRAIRDVDLLSENLLLAAGIQLPDSAQLPAPTADDIQRFIGELKATRAPLMQAMLAWYKGDDLPPAMQDLAAVLSRLAQACNPASQLQSLVALFDSAAVVAEALGTTEIQSDRVLKHQFAQLERLLRRWTSLVPDDFPLQAVHSPNVVFRNFLYTIATRKLTSGNASALREQFDLELFQLKNEVGNSQRFAPNSVSTALSQSVRDSIMLEIEALQRWLSQATNDPNHSDAVSLRERLAQLEPALAMLDEKRALPHLVAINSSLASLANGAAENTREKRLDIAQSTIQFRRSLEQQQIPQAGLNQFSELLESSGDETTGLAYSDHPQHQLLQQAQRQLHSIEQSLETLFARDTDLSDKPSQLMLHQAREALQELDQVLQILPLPEGTPLISGMRSFLEYCTVQSPGMQSKRYFAELLVCVDYYLASVLGPNDTASQLLMNAEVIVQQLEHSVAAESDPVDSDLDETQVIAISGDALTSMIDVSLEQMAVVGDQLHSLNGQPKANGDAHLQQLIQSWSVLRSAAEQHKAADMRKLADGNIELLHRVQAQSVPLARALPWLEESHAVLPQLMDQHQGHSDHIAGFSDLLSGLGSVVHDTGEPIVPADPQSPAVAEPVVGDSENDQTHPAFDSTLQHVFYQECDGHIETLRSAAQNAQHYADDPAFALPTAAVLRALHTLTGSAQTVGEQSVTNLVQPLQKVALLRQRANAVFNDAEVVLANEVVDALAQRVSALRDGLDAGDIAKQTQQAITDCAQNLVNQPPSLVKPVQASERPVEASLQSVFVDEAVELLDQMRNAWDQHKAGNIGIQNLLDELKLPVHTLKGSARMAGFTDFASRVHDLESQLAASDQADVGLVERELASMHAMLLPQGKSRVAVSSFDAPAAKLPADDNISVSETGFARMMSLATQASVSQARLGEQLLRLNEIYRDLDSSTQRLRKQVHNSARQPTAAEQEMLADLDAARTALASTLQSAESEHLQGSRADAELQQSLIRAQLVNFGACQSRLERALQDTAQHMGLDVALQFSGAAINMDRALYRQLLGPLEHLVRNAVAHGIEAPPTRITANKPSQGKVVVQADLDGNDLVISVKDDGAGIDVERINNNRVAAGKPQLETGQALRDALCEAGFSTRESVDEIAGRGMGLAVVNQLAISLGGNLQLASVPGAGTTISLRLPQKVVVNQVVLVRCGSSHYAIPVKFVHTVLAEPSRDKTVHEFNGRQYVAHSLPMLLGDQQLAQTSPSLFIRDKAKNQASILVQAGDKHIALDVDAVVGYREIIAQAIGSQLMSLQRYRGGSVLADGTAVLIVDMPIVIQGLATSIAVPKPQQGKHTPVALVVDDSITMRVAAEHFLEEQNIQSRMARDGIEALSMLQQQLPDVLLLDIDMPRLNGLELLQHLRQLYPDHQLPIVMISTRNGEVEQEKARALGAGHFIGKPYHAAQLHAALCKLGIIGATDLPV